MKLNAFVKILQDMITSGMGDWEVEVDLDHTLSPDVMNIELSKKKTVTIIKGNCGF